MTNPYIRVVDLAVPAFYPVPASMGFEAHPNQRNDESERTMLLTPKECDQLHRASDVMLRPFAHATLAAYLRAAASEVRPLLGAYAAVCGCRNADGSFEIVSDDYPEEDVLTFAKWKLADGGTERALAQNLEVFSMRRVVGLDWDLLEIDSMMNEWYYPHGLGDVVGLLVRWPEDGAFVIIEFHHHLFGLPRMGTEGEAILNLLLPSLRAGARLLYSAGQHRATLANDLESAGVALCVCQHDGQIVHASPSASQILAGDPDRALIQNCIRALAQQVAPERRHALARRGWAPRAHEIVQTRHSSYRISCALASHDMCFGASDILVTVSPVSLLPPTNLALISRYQMTAREADVALCLARGENNAQISATLGISPHTARRHTERIFLKMGVASRAEAAATLRS